MTSPDGPASWAAELEKAFQRSGLTVQEVWLRQVSVGGDASELEVEAHLLGILPLDRHQFYVLAQAFNDHFIENGADLLPIPDVPDCDARSSDDQGSDGQDSERWSG